MKIFLRIVNFYCFTGLRGVCSDKILLRWPLTPEVCTDQVLSNPDLRFSYCPRTLVQDLPAPHTPPVSPFSVNLSADSFLDLRITTTAPSGDYGISAFVKPAINDDSCILHYKSDDGSFEMKFLSTASGTNVSVIGWDSSTFNASLKVGQWQRIAMTMDVSMSRLSLIIEGAPFNDTDVNIFGWRPDIIAPSFKTPGTLRVGGSFEGETFSGLVSCVGFMEDKRIDCSNDCYNSNTWSSINMFPEKRHYGKFSPTETGKIPNQTPISVTSANSLSACALHCLRDFVLCVSVAYNSATGSCSFYPDFFFISLSSSTNTKIYVLQPY
ncbi:uncharacterized protein LOC128191411 [Crassostrea angulata]|uniref:uncharacterized protein LOC128191411 n=1 Tax=Magallana angulata TaxID=2784310 RepID=UPI0022B0E78F|nr:uncharacterized protein LOC128191411 [Crassostrea angulata]